MNGLTSADSANVQTPSQSGGSSELRAILRNTSTDYKVIFGAQRGVFDLTRNDVENFYHLVNQRVGEQNSCEVSTCDVSVYYNDGTSRRFPTIEAFSNYSETRDRFPTLVTLQLSYFICFPDRDTPEKQEIDIVIQASGLTSETVDMMTTDNQIRMSGDKVQLRASSNSGGYGIINYTINHSKISWGLDLEGHIRAHIEKLLVAPSASDRFLSKVSGPLNVITTILVGLYVVNLIIDMFVFFYGTNTSAWAPIKVMSAVEYLLNGQIAKFIVASLVVSVIVFIIFSAFVSFLTSSLKRPRPSFISLDHGDQSRRKERMKKYNKRWLNFFGALAMNVLVGLSVTFLHGGILALLR